MELTTIALAVPAAWIAYKAFTAKPAAAAPATATPKPATIPAGGKPPFILNTASRDKHGRPFLLPHPSRGGISSTAFRAWANKVIQAGGALPSGLPVGQGRRFMHGKKQVFIPLADAIWLNIIETHSPDQRVVGNDQVRADYAAALNRVYAAAIK